jgi:flap endonuclease-1
MLVFGSKIQITNINYQKKYFELVYLKNILNDLDITYKQLVDIVVLSGCDYCTKLENITINKAYKLILEHKKLDNIFNKNNKYFTARDIFLNTVKIKKSFIKN